MEANLFLIKYFITLSIRKLYFFTEMSFFLLKSEQNKAYFHRQIPNDHFQTPQLSNLVKLNLNPLILKLMVQGVCF